MTTRARRAAACAGSVALATIVPMWLCAAGLLFWTIPGAALPAALSIAAGFYLPAAVLIARLERRPGLGWNAPLFVLEVSTVCFAAGLAFWAFPAQPGFSRMAACWLIASGPVVALSLHGLVVALARAGRAGE